MEATGWAPSATRKASATIGYVGGGPEVEGLWSAIQMEFEYCTGWFDSGMTLSPIVLIINCNTVYHPILCLHTC